MVVAVWERIRREGVGEPESVNPEPEAEMVRSG